MGTTTFAEFKQYVKHRFGNDDELDTGSSSGTNYYGKWVNDAYLLLTTQQKLWALKRRFRFPQLETFSYTSTVDGTPYISYPTDAVAIREVFDNTSKYRLRWIPWGKYLGYTDRADTNAEGPPTEWVGYGGYVYLHPTPGAAYTIQAYYRKKPTLLSAASDKTVIGSEWDEAIVDIATYLGKVYMRQFDEAKVFKAEATEKLAGVITSYDQEELSRNEYFQPDPNSISPGY